MQAFEFVDDFRGTKLCDVRLTNRLAEIVRALKPEPWRSFPKAMSPKKLLGYYRFVGNDRVSFEGVIANHVANTISRSQQEAEKIVIHDTTDCECASVDFRAHFSLLVLPNRKPLGVLNTILMRRGSQEKKKAGEPNEHDRWLEGIKVCDQLVAGAIHVYDREADKYNLFKSQVENGIRFVARGNHDRRLADGGRISSALEGTKSVAQRWVPLSTRARGNKSKVDLRSHPIRQERLAKLEISARPIDIVNPRCKTEFLTINLVSVKEVNPPDGETPVEWRLLTNEPINSVSEILKIVDTYRTRWVIEEFFKALKTGCGLEARQHETFEAMSIALAILTPMALQALLLRSLSREDEDYPATEVLSETQLKILALLPRTATLAQATVKQALLAVAALGGHIKNNGAPGWITIGRGLETLRQYEVGWLLATRAAEM